MAAVIVFTEKCSGLPRELLRNRLMIFTRDIIPKTMHCYEKDDEWNEDIRLTFTLLACSMIITWLEN